MSEMFEAVLCYQTPQNNSKHTVYNYKRLSAFSLNFKNIYFVSKMCLTWSACVIIPVILWLSIRNNILSQFV